MINQISKNTITFFVGLLSVCFCQCSSVKKTSSATELSNEPISLSILPSLTDSRIENSDIPHLVMYNESIPKNKLLLFLPGTNGIPAKGPIKLFKVAIEQGYTVINLSYINQPSVARICRGENLEKDPECTKKFRTQRIWGTQLTSLIPDEPQDGIINRFVKLLIHLEKVDKKGGWDMFFDGETPNWDLITVAGQSQGGGMSALIAKHHLVKRIITFSGGWDYSKRDEISKENEIADWYASESLTPPDRWFGIYHTKEPKATVLAETYKAMRIPTNQTFALDLEIRKEKRPHGEGIRNIVYKEMWKKLLN